MKTDEEMKEINTKNVLSKTCLWQMTGPISLI